MQQQQLAAADRADDAKYLLTSATAVPTTERVRVRVWVGR